MKCTGSTEWDVHIQKDCEYTIRSIHYKISNRRSIEINFLNQNQFPQMESISLFFCLLSIPATPIRLIFRTTSSTKKKKTNALSGYVKNDLNFRTMIEMNDVPRQKGWETAHLQPPPLSTLSWRHSQAQVQNQVWGLCCLTFCPPSNQEQTMRTNVWHMVICTTYLANVTKKLPIFYFFSCFISETFIQR